MSRSKILNKLGHFHSASKKRDGDNGCVMNLIEQKGMTFHHDFGFSFYLPF